MATGRARVSLALVANTAVFLFTVAYPLIYSQPAAAMCTRIYLDSKGNGRFSNGCLNYANVYWEDQGACHGGCSVGGEPRTEQSISTPKGQFRWWECEGRSCNPKP
jgi:hypothetical protein